MCFIRINPLEVNLPYISLKAVPERYRVISGLWDFKIELSLESMTTAASNLGSTTERETALMGLTEICLGPSTAIVVSYMFNFNFVWI